jgi:REP element-mobilizing transposase RayT
MARPLRIEFEGATCHVTARGSERGKIFFTKKYYEKSKEHVAAAKDKFGFIPHAYVLMTNHYHLIIETPEKNLSRTMQFAVNRELGDLVKMLEDKFLSQGLIPWFFTTEPVRAYQPTNRTSN